jgi:hypothetical protein
MSGAQTKSNKSPVNNMGIGIESTAQRKASGNKAIKAGSREAMAKVAARAGIKPRGKAKGKGKGLGRANPPVVLPDPVPVIIPVEPDEEDLGLPPAS